MAQNTPREPVVTTEGAYFTNDIYNAFRDIGDPLATEKGIVDPDPITSGTEGTSTSSDGSDS